MKQLLVETTVALSVGFVVAFVITLTIVRLER